MFNPDYIKVLVNAMNLRRLVVAKRHGLAFRHPRIGCTGDPRVAQSMVNQSMQARPVKRAAEAQGAIPRDRAQMRLFLAPSLSHQPLENGQKAGVNRLAESFVPFDEFDGINDFVQIKTNGGQGDCALPEAAGLVEPKVEGAPHPQAFLTFKEGNGGRNLLIGPNEFGGGGGLAQTGLGDGVVFTVATVDGFAYDRAQKLDFHDGAIAATPVGLPPKHVFSDQLAGDLGGHVHGRILRGKESLHRPPPALVNGRGGVQGASIGGLDPRHHPFAKSPSVVPARASRNLFFLGNLPCQEFSLTPVSHVARSVFRGSGFPFSLGRLVTKPNPRRAGFEVGGGHLTVTNSNKRIHRTQASPMKIHPITPPCTIHL